MWKEWLERTLTRGAANDDAPKAAPCLFDVTLSILPIPANANRPEPPPPMHRADAGECVDA